MARAIPTPTSPSLRRIPRPAGLWRIAPVLGLWGLLGCAQAVRAASWQDAPQVVYVAAGSPFAEEVVTTAIQYAVDAWSARVSLPLHYDADGHAQAGYQQGRIVIRWLDTLEMVENSNNILSLAATRRWVYPVTEEIAGVEIYLHRESFMQRGADACFTHAVLHEMGHALGISHLPEPHAVMSASLGTCQHTLTTEDIAAAPYPQHICHAELLPGHDIYVPVININGTSFSARLQHAPPLWNLVEYREVAPQPQCNDAFLDGDNLVIDKVWTQDHTWQGGLRRLVDGSWVLTYAR